VTLLLATVLALSGTATGETQDIPAFHVTGTVDAGIWETLVVLLDVGKMTDWDTECLKSEVIKQPSRHRVLWRYVSDVPWPADDREAVVWTTVKVVEPGKHIRIEFKHAGKDEAPPPSDGQVRVPLLKGRWVLTAKGPDKTHVDYRAKTQAGGSVPDFLVAQMGESSPKALLKGLKKRAAQVHKSGEYAQEVKAWAASH
jgi:hypothetical protein